MWLLRKWWFWLAAVVGVFAAFAFVMDPYRIPTGLLRREPFFDGRPASYWREHLRKQGLSTDTLELFGPRANAGSVLRVLLEDSDRTVQSSAIRLAQRSSDNDLFLLGLRAALRSDDEDLVQETVTRLPYMGAGAKPFIADLAKLVQVPVNSTRTSFLADWSLWNIDPEYAQKAAGWTPVRSETWGFAAMFPGKPDTVLRAPRGRNDPGILHVFEGRHVWTQCVVGVAAYRRETMDATTSEQRLARVRDLCLNDQKAKLLKDDPVERDGLDGRECVFEIQERGLQRTRLFAVEQKIYFVGVTADKNFLHPRVAEFFLDSFHVLSSVKNDVEPVDQ